MLTAAKSLAAEVPLRTDLRFFMRFTCSAIRRLGSESAQKLCIFRVTSARKIRIRIRPIFGHSPITTLMPPRKTSRPETTNRCVGRGHTFGCGVMRVQSSPSEMTEAADQKKPPKRTQPMRNITAFVSMGTSARSVGNRGPVLAGSYLRFAEDVSNIPRQRASNFCAPFSAAICEIGGLHKVSISRLPLL